MKTPIKYWPCSCHKCGTGFPSTNAIAIVCPSCTSGKAGSTDYADLFKDIFNKRPKQN